MIRAGHHRAAPEKEHEVHAAIAIEIDRHDVLQRSSAG